MSALSTTPSSSAMSPSSIEQQELRALDNAIAVYTQTFGWPVEVDPHEKRVSLIVGEHVGGLVVPEPLATAITHALVQTMQPAAVLTTGKGHWSTILTGANLRAESLPMELTAARVHGLPDGEQVMLPIPGQPRREARWVIPPRAGTTLPTYPLVLALARRSLEAVSA